MDKIEHQGTVTAVNPGRVSVQITSYSACHNCDARHGCGLMDCKNKNIDINTEEAAAYTPGEKVILSMTPSSGLLAVFYAYGLPLILMMAAIVIAAWLKTGELTAGISAIIILIPYYFWLFLNRKRFQKRFTFSISKL